MHSEHENTGGIVRRRRGSSADRRRRPTFLAHCVGYVVAVLFLFPQWTVANVVVNGDFSNTTGWGAIGSSDIPYGWSGSQNNALQQTAPNAIGGTGTSALLVPDVGTISQGFQETAADWQLDMDFACEDPGGADTRCLSGSVFNGGNALITYRVNGAGDFQVYDRGGAGWHTPSGLAGAVTFDDNVQTDPLTHRFTLTGHFDLPTPTYDIVVTNSNQTVFQALGLTDWNKPISGDVGIGPTTGQGIDMLDLPTGLSAGYSVVDNISIVSDSEPPDPTPFVPGHVTQLFVDDVMVADRSGVVRRAHACEKPAEPVLEAEPAWETDGWDRRVYVYGTTLYDPAESEFRMWYMHRGSTGMGVSYSTSSDGVTWDRPNLGQVEFEGSTENNMIDLPFASPSVIYDEHESDPAKRYKMAGCDGGYVAAYSADGLNWTRYSGTIASGGDTCTLAQDPHTREYLFFFKKTHEYLGEVRRLVYLTVSPDMENWSTPKLVMAPDAIDDAQTEAEGGLYSQFYNMSVFPYGDQFLGMVTHFRYSGPPEESGPGQSSADGPIDVQLVYSRDGRTWYRLEDRSPVIPNGPYDYDAGCILGVSNTPVSVDGEEWMYYTGITTTHGGYLPDKEIVIARAAWRRDGFVSLDADGDGGTVTTVPFELTDRYLTINAVTGEGGSIRAELLDADGEPLSGYAVGESSVFSGDSLSALMRWSGEPIDELLLGEEVQLRFYLENASLYSYQFHSDFEWDALPGDLNGDGVVKSEDLDMVRAHWGETVEIGTDGDANGDGFVNSADLDLVRGNWGRTQAFAVPEPGAALLWVVVCLFVSILGGRRRYLCR